MTLLEIDQLSLRFGGITAVKEFSLRVKSGEIVSIIGPNGAGKTTVFNAITGIYPPSSGEIRFQGAVIAKPLTWRVVLGCLLVGAISALILGMLMSNVDLFWYAAVRRPHNIEQVELNKPEDDRQRVTIANTIAAAREYLRGDLAIEPARRKWRMVSADGTISLLDFREADEAQKFLLGVEQLQVLQNPTLPWQETAGSFALKLPTGAMIEKTFSASEKADFERQLALIRNLNDSRQRYAWLGLIAGFILGVAGNYAIWSRSRTTPDVVSRGGIARTFQNIRLFHHMSALENVLVGQDRKRAWNLLDSVRRVCGLANGEQRRLQEAHQLLAFMGLEDRHDCLAKNLPYGDQRRLEIARAMATQPRLLLLDEPAAGMNPAESEELMHLIRKICDRGMTILLIEHHMKLVMGISDRVAVLEYGEGIAEGTPAEVRANPKVIEAYLGKEEVS